MPDPPRLDRTRREDCRVAAPAPRSLVVDLAAADRHAVAFVRDDGARGIEDDEASAVVTCAIAIPPDDLPDQALFVAKRNARRRVAHKGAGDQCRHAGLWGPRRLGRQRPKSDGGPRASTDGE